MELLSIIGIKCSWDSCFGDYSGNPEGIPGARGRTRKCSGKTWGIEKQVDMNQVTPEEWIKDTGETVQSNFLGIALSPTGYNLGIFKDYEKGVS